GKSVGPAKCSWRSLISAQASDELVQRGAYGIEHVADLALEFGIRFGRGFRRIVAHGLSPLWRKSCAKIIPAYPQSARGAKIRVHLRSSVVEHHSGFRNPQSAIRNPQSAICKSQIANRKRS